MSGVKRDVANDESDARKQDEMYLIILKNIHVDRVGRGAPSRGAATRDSAPRLK
jgi:hypothetical protein